MSVKSRDNCAD